MSFTKQVQHIQLHQLSKPVLCIDCTEYVEYTGITGEKIKGTMKVRTQIEEEHD